MSILINKETKVICQGFTGSKATFHSEKAITYGTQLVCGVTPKKGGTTHLGLPVFNTVKEAVEYANANVSIIYVPAKFCKDSILEAIDSGIKLIVVITEGVPILDMLIVKSQLQKKNVKMIGPNCPGIITPGESIIGIMPTEIYTAGNIGIVSRSGTLTYEAVKQITDIGYGQSTCIGIGGDPIIGLDFVDVIKLFNKDSNTELILMIGEIGGNLEIDVANFVKTKICKPIVGYIAGVAAPEGKRMGHAGAIISSVEETAREKYKILKDAGIIMAKHFTDIGVTINNVLKSSDIHFTYR